ncbi:hypothetical protein O0I10_011472 [Lichtheimia ornata]|uniref:Heterokaryon incompatibility domain-containing protein n=1 Tax=Lichtheimia ornata TaxID=688661 RepID=A0AAD7USZ6_9FUNG|nr:uncharacterized protein O0I10_011472 [Lichtheimia ornata]KAJ8652872.1 hypothetical protein O0I10_011472 [Lichtheimia ornata]
MKLVKPASDSYHRNRIMQRINKGELTPSTWYALSHLWNISKTNQHMWDDIFNYVEDENGHPMEPVPMRLEKRNTLLKLLEDKPDSYWWIDVLCARSNDFPFDILGNVYACCTRCIAMIDCDPDIIPQMYSMWDMDPDFSSADRSLNDFLDQYEQLNHHILLLTQCIWWTRVWMWQETVLPQDVLLMAETANQVSNDHMLHVDDLYHFEAKLGRMLLFFMENGIRPLHAPAPSFKELRASRRFNMDLNWMDLGSLVTLLQVFGQSCRECKYAAHYVYGVLGVFQFDIPSTMTDPNQVWQCFLHKFEHFISDLMRASLSTTKETGSIPLITISDRARQFDLSTAQNMADVYRDLLVVFDSVYLHESNLKE